MLWLVYSTRGLVPEVMLSRVPLDKFSQVKQEEQQAEVKEAPKLALSDPLRPEMSMHGREKKNQAIAEETQLWYREVLVAQEKHGKELMEYARREAQQMTKVKDEEVEEDEEVLIVKSVEPIDADGQEYETPDIIICLDKVERKAFSHDYGFYDAMNGKMEAGDTLLERDDIWD